MARTSNSFGRGKSSKAPQPTVLVICEDLKSGKKYIEDAAFNYRVRLTVEVVHIGKTDPKNIVIEGQRRLMKYDRVFCVLDRDSHTSWDEAHRMAAKTPKLEIVATYPCFEYWLILHFRNNRKPYVREGNRSPGDCCVADLRQCESMEQYAKGKDDRVFDRLLNRLPSAKSNAAAVLSQSEKDGEKNPSTQMHLLLGYLEGLEAE